jgi:hypothetical protein
MSKDESSLQSCSIPLGAKIGMDSYSDASMMLESLSGASLLSTSSVSLASLLMPEGSSRSSASQPTSQLATPPASSSSSQGAGASLLNPLSPKD